VRAFLRRAGAAGGPPGERWRVADFDYWRFHWLRNVVERGLDDLFCWETGDGELVSVLLRGDPGVCHLHVAPEARSAALEEEMIDTAEAALAIAKDDGRMLWVWADEDDALRSGLLARRGYETYMSDHAKQHNRRHPLGDPLPEIRVPEGYAVRAMRPGDRPARSLASWRAFHPGEPDAGSDASGAWYRNVQSAPTYRSDLDCVVTARNAEIVSFATCYFDEGSREGVFVLVGTAAAHQREGLATAAAAAVLRGLKRLGARAAYVASVEPAAHAFYASVGFVECRRAQAWRKRLA